MSMPKIWFFVTAFIILATLIAVIYKEMTYRFEYSATSFSMWNAVGWSPFEEGKRRSPSSASREGNVYNELKTETSEPRSTCIYICKQTTSTVSPL